MLLINCRLVLCRVGVGILVSSVLWLFGVVRLLYVLFFSRLV